jgi:hypothetical protein
VWRPEEVKSLVHQVGKRGGVFGVRLTTPPLERSSVTKSSRVYCGDQARDAAPVGKERPQKSPVRVAGVSASRISV